MTIVSNIFQKYLLPLCAGLCLAAAPAYGQGENGATLDGVWNSRLWPSFQLQRGPDGLYKGRLAAPDQVCGLAAGDEVLNGTIDSQGIFSGEIRVCAKRFCPGIQERWIYFMALASGNAIALSGAIAPTSYLGCAEVFQGMPFIATKTGALPQPKSPAARVPAEDQPGCATKDAMGTLELTNIPKNVQSIMVDTADWSSQPFVRPVQSGLHQIHLRLKNTPETTETQTFCLPGGPSALSINVGELFGIKTVQEEPERSRSSASCPRGTEKVQLTIVLPQEKKFSITIDGRLISSSSPKTMRTKLTVGEHTIAIRGKNAASEKVRTICVKPGGAQPMTVKFDK